MSRRMYWWRRTAIRNYKQRLTRKAKKATEDKSISEAEQKAADKIAAKLAEKEVKAEVKKDEETK